MRSRSRRLRTDRMLRRVRETRTVELLRASGEHVRAILGGEITFPAHITAEEIDRWQRAWDETMASDQPHRVITLPHRAEWTPRPSRPRKSSPRGHARMREHTRSLLLNALRGDGTPRSAARIAICRAYRVLPDEIGLSHVGRIADGIRSAEEIREGFAADMAADLGIITADLSFDLPDGLEFAVSEDPRGTQIELARPPTPWIDPNGAPTE